MKKLLSLILILFILGLSACGKVADADTVAPKVVFKDGIKTSVMQGEWYSLPSYTLSDKTGVDYENCSIAIYEPESDTPFFKGGIGFKVSKSGEYRLVISATDVLGNTADYEYIIKSEKRFVDTELADGVIMDFDETDYIQFVESRYGYGNQTTDIELTEDYPESDEIIGIGGAGKVLKTQDNKLYSEGYNLYITFPQEITPETGDEIIIRCYQKRLTGVRPNGKGEYQHFFFYFLPYHINTANSKSILESDTPSYNLYAEDGCWVEKSIPAQKLIDANTNSIKGIQLFVSNVFYLDSIRLEQSNSENFVDTDISTGTLLDFDESGYKNVSYDQRYNMKKGSVAFLNDTNVIPVANDYGSDTLTYSKGVMCLYEKNNGVFRTKITLINPLDIADSGANYLRVKFWYKPGLSNSLIVFNQSKIDYADLSTYCELVNSYDYNSKSERWIQVLVPISILADDKGQIDHLVVEGYGTLYIDEIGFVI